MKTRHTIYYPRLILLLGFMGYLLIFSLTSSEFQRAVPLPLTINRFLTLLQYIPFVAVVCYKFVKDVRKCRVSGTLGVSCFTVLYYWFLVYYIFITVYRFVAHMEVKENFYYTIVLVGSLALFILLLERELVFCIKDYVFLAFWIVGLLLLYRIIYLIFFSKVFERSPINVNLTTGIVAMMMPVLFRIAGDKEFTVHQRMKSALLIFLTLFIVTYTGSRSIFWLSILIVIIEILFSLFKWRRRFLSIIAPVILSIVCIVLFYGLDIGEMRYSIYRETNGFISELKEESQVKSVSEPVKKSTAGTSTANPPAPSNSDVVSPDTDVNAAKMQVVASDRVRSQLMEWGSEQVKKNWLIGSGDVLYMYRMDDTHIYEQSAHNFIIETIICYGIIGMAILIMIVIRMLSGLGLIPNGMFTLNQSKIMAILMFLFYIVFGFVQPTVYHPLVCPIILLFLTFQTDIKEGEFRHN